MIRRRPSSISTAIGDWTVAKGGEDIFWVSERDGWGHLYRYASDGTLKNQVERGSYKVADIVRVDSARKQIYFTAWGKEAGSRTTPTCIA